MGKISTIPAGQNFARTLATWLIETYDAQALADVHIYMPSTRACRAIATELETLLPAKSANLMPRMFAIGDLPELDMRINIAAQTGTLPPALPRAMPGIQRHVLLAKLIHALPGSARSISSSMALARELATLMDHIHTQGLDFAIFDQIVPEDLAAHWQITYDFLLILRDHWPAIMAEHNAMDPTQRRDALIRQLAAHFTNHPAQHPVIAAGSTGSIPATTELLKTISQLPEGHVIFPGLDLELPESEWNALTLPHPQAILKSTLATLNHTRAETGLIGSASSRHTLAQAVMTQHQSIASKIDKAAFDYLNLYTLADEQTEATMIALHFRATLETPGKTAMLITPDRALARRVAAICHRWGIKPDDSSGQPFTVTPQGIFHGLLLSAWQAGWQGADMLAMLKHPHCSISDDIMEWQTNYERALRTNTPIPGAPEALSSLPQTPAGDHSANDLFATHQQLIKILCASEDETAQNVLHDIETAITALPDITLKDYADLILSHLQNHSMRTAFGVHPRIRILGQIEARMSSADLVILAGLNEGSWPDDNTASPWMSRLMQQKCGLPNNDQYISLSAHDFVQGVCAPHVILTRSIKSQGTDTIPARWLQRLHAIMQQNNIAPQSLQELDMLSALNALFAAEGAQTIERPAPCPPVNARPTQLPVTDIETWLRDPYSLYAKRILRLKKLPHLEDDQTAANKGTALHAAQEAMINASPVAMPDPQTAHNIMITAIQKNHQAPESWPYDHAEYSAIIDRTLTRESAWQRKAKPLATEINGRISLPITGHNQNFTLTARADRIDQTQDLTGAIIDYKSGGTYSIKGIAEGHSPQIALEALILQHGGYKDIKPMTPSYLGYWLMQPRATGKSNDAVALQDQETITTLITNVENQLTHLVTLFMQESTPYISIPRAGYEPRFADYAHLARIAEWSANEAEEAAA